MATKRRARTNPEARLRVQRVIRLLKRRAGDLTTKRAERLRPRAFAAAGLARCLALLEGIYLLSGARRGDVAGVLMRSLCEVWAVSLYVLWRGPEALPALAFNASEQFRKMQAEMGSLTSLLTMMEGLAKAHKLVYKRGERAGQHREVKVHEIFDFVIAELERRDPSFAKLARTVRERPYRLESAFSTHGGLPSIVPYVNSDGPLWGLKLRPRAKPGPNGSQESAAMLTAALASVVYDGFGYDAAPFAALADSFTVKRPRQRRRKQLINPGSTRPGMAGK